MRGNVTPSEIATRSTSRICATVTHGTASALHSLSAAESFCTASASNW
jgi:hypothetical protein